MSKQFARTQVRAAVNTRNGPDTTDINNSPIGSHVLVYRPEIDKWNGPFALLDMQGEACTILLPSGPTQFRSTVVKRYLSPVVPGSDGSGARAPVNESQVINGDPDVTAMISHNLQEDEDDLLEIFSCYHTT